MQLPSLDRLRQKEATEKQNDKRVAVMRGDLGYRPDPKQGSDGEREQGGGGERQRLSQPPEGHDECETRCQPSFVRHAIRGRQQQWHRQGDHPEDKSDLLEFHVCSRSAMAQASNVS